MHLGSAQEGLILFSRFRNTCIVDPGDWLTPLLLLHRRDKLLLLPLKSSPPKQNSQGPTFGSLKLILHITLHVCTPKKQSYDTRQSHASVRADHVGRTPPA